MSQREGDVYMTGICAPSGLHSVYCGAVPLVRFSTSGPLYWFANDWDQGLEIDQDEATIEEASSAPRGITGLPNGLPPQAKFVDHMHLYPTPSAFIKALVAELPSHERLTRDRLMCFNTLSLRPSYFFGHAWTRIRLHSWSSPQRPGKKYFDAGRHGSLSPQCQFYACSDVP